MASTVQFASATIHHGMDGDDVPTAEGPLSRLLAAKVEHVQATVSGVRAFVSGVREFKEQVREDTVDAVMNFHNQTHNETKF